MAFESTKFKKEPRVIIIGGGVAGIMTAIAFKKQLGFSNFTLYEQSDDLGGTWNLNTYPGCASDVATHWYSFSSDLNPDWNQSHVFQPELKAYWKGLSAKYDINKHVRLHTQVVSADWDPRNQVYRLEVLSATGEKRTEYANAIVSAIGTLNVPHYPDELKGIRDVFKGEHFHSARWDHSVDLRNKRVGVIGNGCSAAQFVPIIAEDPTTQVVSFGRTPNWFMPRWRTPIPSYQRMLFRHVPFAMRIYRWLLMTQYEAVYMFIVSGGPRNSIRERLCKQLVAYIKDNAPEKYHQMLIPTYPFGCKRFIVDPGYLEALHRPNNDVNFDGIAEVTEKGILTKKGKHFDCDVIIEATGFIVDEFPIKMKGRDGATIQEYFQAQGGPTAYKGTAVPNFPNFYTIFGPNTTTGHGSVIYTEEVQIDYIMQMLSPVINGLASSFEVTHEATDAWNARIHKKLSTAVWSACQSWYRVGHDGKNSSIWPGLLIEQWWQLRRPVWSHYKAVGAYKWQETRRGKTLWEIAEVGGAIAALGWAYMHPDEISQVAAYAQKQYYNQEFRVIMLLGVEVQRPASPDSVSFVTIIMDILPETNEEYGTKEYWDQRYSQEAEDDSFDWFKTYSDITPILSELIPSKDARILMLGCGNSKLSEEMYDDGYKNIVNIDVNIRLYSGILIERMQHKHSESRPEMQWFEMDVRDLKFEPGSFDVAIDKGTMDAMMTAKGDVWVSIMHSHNVDATELTIRIHQRR
ncbi:hypothetical protein EUX98_g4084 [Antrodiella citrinella]|uniref:Methyltransferase domain-containing protein n=1 Tax=Antrodiella citrinella TaxID=2447956 RepID=A0A4S4MWZ3_9APHY|nr:hypothetical protein EUX98_g4084 [Antrodiella citrinella]